MAASYWLTAVIDKNLSGKIIEDFKERFAVALFKICMEHRNAAVILVKLNGRSSAAAIARSAFEAYVLGLWVNEFGDAEQLRKILKGEGRPGLPKFDPAITALKKAKHPLSEILEKYREFYKGLSDYAHGHGLQVSRWITKEEIAFDHTDAEMLGLLSFVDLLALFSALAIERIANQDDSFGIDLVPLIADGGYRDPKMQSLFNGNCDLDLQK